MNLSSHRQLLVTESSYTFSCFPIPLSGLGDDFAGFQIRLADFVLASQFVKTLLLLIQPRLKVSFPVHDGSCLICQLVKKDVVVIENNNRKHPNSIAFMQDVKL